VFLTDQLF
jgi:folylpolyglutamate synthase